MNIVIIGGGRHALVVRDCLLSSPAQIVGILDDRIDTGTFVGDLTVVGPVTSLTDLKHRHPALHGIIAIGDNHSRRRIAERIAVMLPGFDWAKAIHASAIVSPSAHIAPGAVVVAGAIINCHAVIEPHALVNTGSIIDHDSRLGAFASTGPGVVTGGNVSIGTGSHIGLGAVLSHGIHVGDHAVVGGNSFVSRNIPDHTVSYGSPARVIRSRNEYDVYL